MKNLTRILGILILMGIGSSCERDEICVEEITPKLIIRFYDSENPVLLKDVISLKVNIEGVDEDYVNETITTLTDSIALPLNVTGNRTQYVLTLQANEALEIEENSDTIFINYTQEDEFVSRSCGYRALFYDVTGGLETDDDNWIDVIETVINPLEITNENSAHVKIYH